MDAIINLKKQPIVLVGRGGGGGVGLGLVTGIIPIVVLMQCYTYKAKCVHTCMQFYLH